MAEKRATSSRRPRRAKPRAARPKRTRAAPPRPAAAPSTIDRALVRLSGPTGVPIVGIGASAGGLDALDAFLRNVDAPTGTAFVVVQHLDPAHGGKLVALLQRATRMPVVHVTDRLPVEVDHVYVIPPNADISLRHGTLHVAAAARQTTHPIDVFLRSLAEEQRERAIGVILSGMGSDGTLGLAAIKEHGGASFVQALASAKYDSMPRSAIEAGHADVVAPVEDLPARIASYVRHTPATSQSEVHVEARAQRALDNIFELLRVQTGNDFSLYKRTTIYRRIERRMALHQIDTLAHYVRFLRVNPFEVELLFKELLIGVTSFFRDPQEWDRLERDVLPALIAQRESGGELRAWVAGCSTGEEAYSLAIVLREALDASAKDVSLRVFATDLDRDAMDRARVGLYPENIVTDVSPGRLRRFFVREDGHYRVSKELRDAVVFAPHNLIMDPPVAKVDVLCCRNLLIYLSGQLQKKLIPLFHYSLRPGGVLFLSNAETVGSYTNLFSPLDGKSRLYRRVDQPAAKRATPPFVGRSRAQSEDEGPPAANLQTLADRVIVQRYSPLGVLCNDKGDILYISGRAETYLEPAAGKTNLNVFAMAREGLRDELPRAFAAALRDGREVATRNLEVAGGKRIDLTVQRLSEPTELAGTVMVIIADAPVAAAGSKVQRAGRVRVPPRIAQLEHELQRARDEIQTSREEMQTSQEELKTTNEELQTANDELQSKFDELSDRTTR